MNKYFKPLSSIKRYYSANTLLNKAIPYDAEGFHNDYQNYYNTASNEYLSEGNPSALMIDLNKFRSRCHEVHDAFSAAGLKDNMVKHTYALKALQLPALLNEINNLDFMGVECIIW